MGPIAGDNRPPHHEFALELERARREAGLKPKDLASKLFLDPRSVRRYLNGERLPTIETTQAWESACNIEAGRLTRIHPASSQRNSVAEDSVAEDGSASSAQEANPAGAAGPRTGPRKRRRWRVSAAASIAVFATLGALLLPHGGDNPDVGEPPRDGPTGVAYHRFTKSYVGDVWIRITPARARFGGSHRVTLRWGPLAQDVDLKDLDGPWTLFTGKNRPDRVTLRVTVKPAATIEFGEGNVPTGALDIKRGWTKPRSAPA